MYICWTFNWATSLSWWYWHWPTVSNHEMPRTAHPKAHWNFPPKSSLCWSENTRYWQDYSSGLKSSKYPCNCDGFAPGINFYSDQLVYFGIRSRTPGNNSRLDEPSILYRGQVSWTVWTRFAANDRHGTRQGAIRATKKETIEKGIQEKVIWRNLVHREYTRQSCFSKGKSGWYRQFLETWIDGLGW